MQKILLAAINARYSHTNPAVRSIQRFVQKRVSTLSITTAEWTISQPIGEIIRGVAETQPEMLLFSVYIWNSTLVLQSIRELRKIFPQLLIGMGGPEVSYRAEFLMTTYDEIDFIMKGEGEETCAQIAAVFAQSDTQKDFLQELSKIAGIFYRNQNNTTSVTLEIVQNDGNKGCKTILFSGECPLIADMATLPFIYTEDGTTTSALSTGFSPQNQLAYYETSRGCPFQCSYCLSSLDKTVRYLPLERVLEEIGFFLHHKFRTIKCTDRTFNLNPARYLAIWRYIGEHYNGITTFHFEIDAQHLCEQSFEVLRSLPAGAVQFEIGLQSTNAQTLAEIRRSADLQKTAQNIARIPDTVHVHLDLIAGLPHEDFDSFKNSFDFAAALKPHMLQLGFLKVLSGTHMEQTVRQSGYEYFSVPPYEILQTPVLPYRDLCRLKDIEHLLDVFYNSRQFSYTLLYVSDSLFDFLSDFVDFFEKKEAIYRQRTVADNFSVLFAFTQTLPPQKAAVLEQLLRFDFILLGKTGSFPPWYMRHYDKSTHEKALRIATDFFVESETTGEKQPYPPSTREQFARSDYEEFSVNPLKPDFPQEQIRFLFLYPKRGETGLQNYSSKNKTHIRTI